MGIEAKHAYRFGFLKSEEWRTMRLICLGMDEGKCVVCSKYDPSNDAHHLFYRGEWINTKPQDLVTLCRECHTKVHELGTDVTLKRLWEKYKHLYKITSGGCFVCNSKGRSFPLKVSSNDKTSVEICVKCWEKIDAARSEHRGNPWKQIRILKEEVRALKIRKLLIENLNHMLFLGMEKKRLNDAFRHAALTAGKKIRKYLLTATVIQN